MPTEEAKVEQLKNVVETFGNLLTSVLEKEYGICTTANGNNGDASWDFKGVSQISVSLIRDEFIVYIKDGHIRRKVYENLVSEMKESDIRKAILSVGLQLQQQGISNYIAVNAVSFNKSI